MNLVEFVNYYNKTKVDYDGNYGAQCVDLFRQYCKDVLNIPHTGSVVGAKDIWENFENMTREKQYFNQLPFHKAQSGDVIVWGATPSNKYGHVAIILGIKEKDVIVFEQDGFRKDGAKIVLRNGSNCLGVMRFKGVSK